MSTPFENLPSPRIVLDGAQKCTKPGRACQNLANLRSLGTLEAKVEMRRAENLRDFALDDPDFNPNSLTYEQFYTEERGYNPNIAVPDVVVECPGKILGVFGCRGTVRVVNS